MMRLRGWGLGLLAALVLLTYTVYSRVQDRARHAEAEHFMQESPGISSTLNKALNAFLKTHGRLARAGDEAALPAPPAGLGIQGWRLSPEGVVEMDIRSRASRRPLRLLAVPRVHVGRPARVSYDLIADEATLKALGLGDQGLLNGDLRSPDDIPVRLAENAARLRDPAGRDQAARTEVRSTGTVLVIPDAAAGGQPCTRQGCLQSVTCASARPLLCANITDFRPTPDRYRGSQFLTLADADAACRQAWGANFQVARADQATRASAARLREVPRGREHWLHAPANRGAANCWGRTPGALID